MSAAVLPRTSRCDALLPDVPTTTAPNPPDAAHDKIASLVTPRSTVLRHDTPAPFAMPAAASRISRAESAVSSRGVSVAEPSTTVQIVSAPPHARASDDANETARVLAAEPSVAARTVAKGRAIT
jgi:hypothetical protein